MSASHEALEAQLARASHVAVLTGAGMSAESGIPTFRDAHSDGLWARFDPYQLASPAGFDADPALVWRWYAWRRQAVARVAPNAGHCALARAAGHGAAAGQSWSLITQNVDGLHHAAGSANVLELHGNLMRSHCRAECGLVVDEVAMLPPGEPPRCPRCGAFMRPSVVWFGEALDAQVLAAAEHAAERCDIMLVVGTSGLVHPAASLPLQARCAGARIVIVNPQPSELDALARPEDLLRETAAQALPRLLGIVA